MITSLARTTIFFGIILIVTCSPDFQQLSEVIEGHVWLPNSPQYQLFVNTVFTLPTDYTPPMAVVQPLNAHDVSHAVRFAKANSIQVTGKGGGHHTDGFNMPERGFQLNFELMKGITVDADNMLATAEPGLLTYEVVEALEPYNLGHAVGNCPVIGIPGFIAYGGWGLWSRNKGLAIDNVVEYEVVTSDGEIRTVNEHCYPDLFFALRGAAPSYVMVTKFTFKVFDTTDFYGGHWTFSGSLEGLKDWWHRVDNSILSDDPNFNSRITLTRSPINFANPFVQSVEFIFELVLFGDMSRADKDALILSELGFDVNNPTNPGFIGEVKRASWNENYTYYNNFNLEGLRAGLIPGTRQWMRQGFVETLTDDVMEQYWKGFDSSTPVGDRMSLFLTGEFSIAGGRFSEIDQGETAYFSRPKAKWLWGFWVASVPIPGLPTQEELCTYFDGIANKLYYEDAQQRGVYANLNSIVQASEFDAYGTNLVRLEKVKSVYDPSNLFSRGFDISTRPGGRCLNFVNGRFIRPERAVIQIYDNIYSNDKIVFQFKFNQDYDPGDMTRDSHFSFAIYDGNYNLKYSRVYEAWEEPRAVLARNYGWKKTRIDGEHQHKILLPFESRQTIQYIRSGNNNRNFLGESNTFPIVKNSETNVRLIVRLEFGNENCIHIEFTDDMVNLDFPGKLRAQY